MTKAIIAVGQRVKYTSNTVFGVEGSGVAQIHSIPKGFAFADVVAMKEIGLVTLDVYIQKIIDGKVVISTVRASVAHRDGESNITTVRGKPFVPGVDARRREGTNPDGSGTPPKVEGSAGEICPVCKTGTLAEKMGRKGAFVGCSNFPACKYTTNTKVGGEDSRSATEDADMNGGDISPEILALAKILAGAGSKAPPATISEADVVKVIDKVAAQKGWGSASVIVKVKDVETKFDGFKHSVLDEVLSHAAQRANIMVVGPAGSGKTTLGEQVAKALFGEQWETKFASMSCSPGMGEGAWLGRLIPNLSTGSVEYHSTPFVGIVRNGGVFLADELDNSDASTILVLNSVLANGHVTLPNGERLAKHKDFVFIGSANTYGHGQSREYVGRSQLDAAFLDRFVGSTVEMDYDRKLESLLCPEDEIRLAVWEVRDAAAKLKLRRIVSTRAILSARRLVLGQNKKIKAALTAITVGWSDADRKAVGVAS